MKYLLSLLLMTQLITACNTIEGLGQDVRQAGEWTAGSARDVKEELR